MEMKRRITLDIDRIVLRGFDRIDREALSAALQQALTQWLKGNPSFRSVDLTRVQARIKLTGGTGTEQTSRMLGQELSGIIAGNSETAAPARPATPGVRHGA